MYLSTARSRRIAGGCRAKTSHVNRLTAHTVRRFKLKLGRGARHLGLGLEVPLPRGGRGERALASSGSSSEIEPPPIRRGGEKTVA